MVFGALLLLPPHILLSYESVAAGTAGASTSKSTSTKYNRYHLSCISGICASKSV